MLVRLHDQDPGLSKGPRRVVSRAAGSCDVTAQGEKVDHGIIAVKSVAMWPNAADSFTAGTNDLQDSP